MGVAQEDDMAATPSRILVATDFSTTADAAEIVAFRLARRLAAELHVVHVRVILEDPLMAEEQQLEIAKLMAATDETGEEVLARGRTDTEEITVKTHLVRSISAAEAIVETASDQACDLIVMGTHGRRGIKHLLLGSVAENVVRSVNVPVLTVRPDSRLPEAGPTRLLVPHDFSDRSAEAMRVAAAWADAFDAELTVLHVVEPVVYPEFYTINVVSDDVMTRLRDRAIEALDESARELLGDRSDVNTSVVVGRAAKTIVSEAESGGFDMVVMGTRGLSDLEQLVLGSVAEGVLRRCPVPLLTVSSKDERDRSR
jgi:nucleotide-binding universal stress UspA family protein